eukprot:jgi/Hompol1/1305/HPOL_000530-RA
MATSTASLPVNTVTEWPIDTPAKTLVSFTGGKDSTLVVHQLRRHNPQLELAGLATFVPAAAKPFLAHAVGFIEAQAAVLGLPHRKCIIDSAKYGGSYLEAYRGWFASIHSDEGISLLATGDIQDVCGWFMGQASETTPVKVLSPLLNQERRLLIEQFEEYKLKPIISCVSLTQVPADLAYKICGRVFNKQLAQEIAVFPLAADSKPIDLCGENGEFHTMCIDGAEFTRPISIKVVDQEDRIITAVSSNGDYEFSGKLCVSEDGKFLFVNFE